MIDEEIRLDEAPGCHTLTSRSYPYHYINNEDHAWDVVARNGDTGIRVMFDTFELEYGYDYLEIGTGAFGGDSQPIIRLTGSLEYSFGLQPDEGGDLRAKEQSFLHRLLPAEEDVQQMHEPAEEDAQVPSPKEKGVSKRSIRTLSAEFCSNSTIYYDQLKFPQVMHLNASTIWLRMTSDSSVTDSGFSLQVTSTRYGGRLRANSINSNLGVKKGLHLL